MKHQFRTAGMIGAVALSAALCFAVSLKVGERREAVEGLKRDIANDTKTIRRLQAEWQMRARPLQLQRLNDTYFGLNAPVAGQFFDSAQTYVAFAANPDRQHQPRVYTAAASQAATEEVIRPTQVAQVVSGPTVLMQMPQEGLSSSGDGVRHTRYQTVAKLEAAQSIKTVVSTVQALAAPKIVRAAQPKPTMSPKPILTRLDAGTMASIERLAATENAVP